MNRIPNHVAVIVTTNCEKFDLFVKYFYTNVIEY
jgi:hypothetical protein